MGKTYRKHLSRDTHSTFEGFYTAHWLDAEFCFRSLGRETDYLPQKARRLWDIASRDGQGRRQLSWSKRFFSTDPLCGHSAAQYNRTATKRAIHRGMTTDDWDDVIFPNKRDAKAKVAKWFT